MALTAVLLGTSISLALACPDRSDLSYADMRDGDKKVVKVRRRTLTITPEDQTWSVVTPLSSTTCSALIDFNVPGKPDPPAGNISAALWYAMAKQASGLVALKGVWEFTDPSGTMAEKHYPLNQWVQLGPAQSSPISPPCPLQWSAVYADMHQGDAKHVAIEGSSLTIRPNGGNESWEVKAPFDTHLCTAEVNFTVPHKPPPSGNLTLSLWKMVAKHQEKTAFHVTDPLGQLAPFGVPMNTWVEVKIPPAPPPSPGPTGCHCDCESKS